MAAMLIGYARISTNGQDDALQLDALSAAGVERVFSDTASGSLASRPQLDAMLAQLRAGDVVVVWRLDRLARSVRHALELAERFEAMGVGLRSLTEQLDTTTPGGRLIFTVFAAMAEFERNLLRERTVAGLAAARERGRVGGRRPALSAEQVATARLLLEQGRTVVDVARILHVSRRTIYRALERAGAEQVAMA